MIFPSDKKWIIALMMFQKYMWIYINIFWPVHKILKTINFNKKIIKIINKCNISGEVYALDDVQLKKMQTMWSRVRHSNKSRVSCIHICRCVAAPSYTESMVHTRLDDRRRWQPIVLFLSVTVPPRPVPSLGRPCGERQNRAVCNAKGPLQTNQINKRD